ncbi:MAG: hypothetical protein NC933_03075 [Candidatus Omnitrophica bacterium]|nr:hypothetical protein [Candidatus Omnitrophota bacterium]
MPAKVLIDYLVKSVGCAAIIIGIQPKSLEFGKPLSRIAERAAERVAKILKDVLPSIKPKKNEV